MTNVYQQKFIWFIYIFFIFLASRSLEAHKHKKNTDCLGPPYLYATTHHEVQNIIKYSRDGCLISTEVLQGGPIFGNHYMELRSIKLGEYKGKEALYVADAMTSDSYLSVYGECDSEGKRTFITNIVSTDVNEGADHTYGICFDQDKNVYASFQHTDVVLRFYKDSSDPMGLPPALRDYHKWRDFYPGTFVQFGKVGIHRLSEQGVRSILNYNDTIWIANEDIGGIVITRISTGVVENIIVVHNPIGLHYDNQSGLIFVGSKKKHWGAEVFGIDPNLLRIVRTYTTNRMNHPTGITSYGDTLFVAEQILGEILSFSISTEKYLGKIVSKTLGEIEQLELSPC